MLRKFVNEMGTDWDQWLPYLMFVHREIPQASMGFLPFQRVYGHEVQGSLSLLKAWWEWSSSKAPKNNVIDYVITKLHKLHQMTELAAAHVREAQKKTKDVV